MNKHPLASCGACPIQKSAMLAYTPNYKARYLVVVPCSDPFKQADDFISQMFQQYGLGKQDYSILPTILCRSMSSWPHMQAVVACSGFFDSELAKHTNAKVIFAMGRESCTSLGIHEKLTQVRGCSFWNNDVRIIPTWHPSKLMETPDLFMDLVHDMNAGIKFAVSNPNIPKTHKSTVWLDVVKTEVRRLVSKEITGPELDSALTVLEKIVPKPDVVLVEDIIVNRIDTIEQFQNFRNSLKKNQYIVCDIETSGFSPFKDRILCIGLAVNRTQSYILTEKLYEFPQGAEAVRELLESRDYRFVFHNAKFDIRFLLNHHLIRATKMLASEDTMLLHYALDERLGTHGLKQLCRQRLGLPDYEQELHAVLPKQSVSYIYIPKSILFHYAARDVCFTFRLLEHLQAELEEEEKYDQLHRLYRFLMDALNHLIEIEDNGIRVDMPTVLKAERDFTKYAGILQMRLRRLTGNPILNPRAPKQVAAAIYDTFKCPAVRLFRNHKERSTGREALDKILAALVEPHKIKQLLNDLANWPTPESDAIVLELEKKAPAVAFILYLMKLREVSKILSTYVKPIQSMVQPNGRIYTDMKLQGTVTGRLAGAKPNLLNIPRKQKNAFAGRIRDFFVASEGHILVDADYASMEMRVAAEFAKEPFWRDAFEKGLDLHSLMAEKIFGPGYSKENRMIAKMFNFGLIYNRGAKSVAVERGLDLAVAEQWMTDFFISIPTAQKWLNNTKRKAIEQGYLETPVGRLRRFGLVTSENQYRIESQACNFPVQSTASDCCLFALMEIHDWLKETGYGKALLMVHDSIILDVQLEYVDVVSAKLKEVMEQAPIKLFGASYIQFRADPASAESWGGL